MLEDASFFLKHSIARCVLPPVSYVSTDYSPGLIDLLLPFYYLPLKSKGTSLLPFGSSGSEVFVCDLDPEPAHYCVSGRFERGPLERIDFSINVRVGHYRGLRRERVKAQHA